MSIDLTPVVCAAHRLPALTTLCRDLDLPLTQGQLAMLAESHDRALQSASRVAFESGGLESLLTAFADSPWLPSEELPETLSALTELFYHLKNRTEDLVSDEALLRRMREGFDECRGSVELLADLLEGGLSDV